MKLWTIQHINFYNQLQETGVAYTTVRSEMWDDNVWAYQLMVEQMKVRIGEPPLPEITTPVWAWFQYKSRKKSKPTYHISSPENKTEVMLELEVPDEYVLLSSFVLWHHPLNGWDLSPKKERRMLWNEIDEFESTHPNAGFADYPQSLQDKIKQNWSLIFDLKSRDGYYVTQHAKNRSIQATLWLVRKEWVVSAVKMSVDDKKNVRIKTIF